MSVVSGCPPSPQGPILFVEQHLAALGSLSHTPVPLGCKFRMSSGFVGEAIDRHFLALVLGVHVVLRPHDLFHPRQLGVVFPQIALLSRCIAESGIKGLAVRTSIAKCVCCGKRPLGILGG